MSALLDPTTADRLAKIAGMFGSDHDGERAAAAQLADRLVRQAGLTWPDVIRPYTNVKPAPEPRRNPGAWREPQTIREAADLALRFGVHLSEWERNFVHSIRDRWRLSANENRHDGMVVCPMAGQGGR